MDLKTAIAKVKKLDAEGIEELASAIETGVSDLEAKAYTLIGEKRTETSKRQSLEAALAAAGKALGIEGDTDKILAELEPKVKAIASEAEQLRSEKASLTTRASDAETKLQRLERQGKISELAAKAGANASVLETLLGDRVDELKVDGDVVKLGDTPLKDAIASDEKLRPFEAALFPVGQDEQKSKNKKLPTAPPNKPTEDKGSGDLLSRYAARTYGGAKAVSATKDKE